jgi:hypothetical protein
MAKMTEAEDKIEEEHVRAKSKLAEAKRNFEAIDRAIQHAGDDADDDLKSRHRYFTKLYDDAKAVFAIHDESHRAHCRRKHEELRKSWLTEAEECERRARELRLKAMTE